MNPKKTETLFATVHEQFFTNAAEWMYPSTQANRRPAGIPLYLHDANHSEEFECTLALKAVDMLIPPGNITFESPADGSLFYGNLLLRENGEILFSLEIPNEEIEVWRAKTNAKKRKVAHAIDK